MAIVGNGQIVEAELAPCVTPVAVGVGACGRLGDPDMKILYGEIVLTFLKVVEAALLALIHRERIDCQRLIERCDGRIIVITVWGQVVFIMWRAHLAEFSPPADNGIDGEAEDSGDADADRQ